MFARITVCYSYTEKAQDNRNKTPILTSSFLQAVWIYSAYKKRKCSLAHYVKTFSTKKQCMKKLKTSLRTCITVTRLGSCRLILLKIFTKSMIDCAKRKNSTGNRRSRNAVAVHVFGARAISHFRHTGDVPTSPFPKPFGLAQPHSTALRGTKSQLLPHRTLFYYSHFINTPSVAAMLSLPHLVHWILPLRSLSHSRFSM